VVLTIGTDGVPVRCDCLEGPPPLRDAAIRYALLWRFEPYMVNGAAQAVRLTLVVPFSLR
jgi:hypothetical protein